MDTKIERSDRDLTSLPVIGGSPAPRPAPIAPVIGGRAEADVERSVSDYRRRLRRNQLLGTAARILSDEGPDAVRIPHVARLCGVTRPSVYKHFANRQELLVGVLVGLEERLDEALVPRLSQSWSDPLRELRGVIEALCDCVAEWGLGAWKLLQAGGTDSETHEITRRIRRKFAEHVRLHVEGPIRGAEVSSVVPGELILAVIHSGVAQWLEGRLGRDDAVEVTHRAVVALVTA